MSKILDQEIQLVIFNLNTQSYGIDMTNIEELTDIQNLIPATESLTCITGRVEVRGKMVPVIDMKKRYHLKKSGNNSNCRILVINKNNLKMGLIVDSVSEMLKIQINSIKPIDSLFIGEHLEHVLGVISLKGKSVLLIDMEKIISETELDAFESSNRLLIRI
jgi:purine-binding chemotaxis protein CheW